MYSHSSGVYRIVFAGGSGTVLFTSACRGVLCGT